MRELQGIDARVASELREQIRQKFKESKADKNRTEIVAKMTDAQRELQFLRQYVGTARWKLTEAPPGTMFGSSASSLQPPLLPSSSSPFVTPGKTQAQAACGHDHSPGEACSTGDSWVGSGSAEDVKGRLGDIWPWQAPPPTPQHAQAPPVGPEKELGQWEARGHSGPLRIPKR